MIVLGTALKANLDPFHRCLVLSDPVANGGHVVLVRVTTHDGTWTDVDCILEPSDWSELAHTSTVAYSTTFHGRALPQLTAAVKKGDFRLICSPPTETLRRIIEIGRTADGMPLGAIAWLAVIP